MKKPIHAKSCKTTNEQLIEAANKLLNCFENVDRWPKLNVAVSKKIWQITLKQKNIALDKKNNEESL